MKYFPILLLILCTNSAAAYDFEIKDNRGHITGYLQQDKEKTYIIDMRGRRSGYVEQDGSVRDQRGRKQATIEAD